MVKQPEDSPWIFLGQMECGRDGAMYLERETPRDRLAVWPPRLDVPSIKYSAVRLQRGWLVSQGRDRRRRMNILTGQSERGTIYWAVVPVLILTLAHSTAARSLKPTTLPEPRSPLQTYADTTPIPNNAPTSLQSQNKQGA